MFDEEVSESLAGEGGISLMTLTYLTCFMNLPSTAIGAIGGFLSEQIKVPTKANRVSRLIPDQPYLLKTKLMILLFGLLPYITIQQNFSRLSESI